MLKLDALNQLKQLKTDIKASRNLQLGHVKGTGQKFGFVSLDSGKDVFLPPSEMLRVLPGDRVEVEIKKDDKNKTFAQVERLVESNSKEFFARYVSKGPAHFAEADFDGSTRWIFIPPNKRGKTKEGSLLKCRLAQHPIKSGKPQAHIIEVIGHDKDQGIEWNYSLAKHRIQQTWSEQTEAALKDLNEETVEALFEGRTDLSEKPFFTIDGEHTSDMDDALCIEAQAKGWKLWVAIADPEALLCTMPKLEDEILSRSSALYAPGKVVPMMPREISSELSSLLEGKKRLAKVFEIEVSEEGEIASYSLQQAVVCSVKKLSYAQASDLENTEFEAPLQEQLNALKALADKTQKWRRAHANVQAPRTEFYIELNEEQKINDIKPRAEHLAHSWVEECMLLANRCAARFLNDKSEKSVFIGHAGIRSDRLDAFSKLVKARVEALADVDFSTLEGFIQLAQTLRNDESLDDLNKILMRQLERTEYKQNAVPHFGLGFSEYTTFTSPLRKANDYLLHKQVRSLLSNDVEFSPSKAQITAIDQGQDAIRRSVFDLEQWLKCEFITRNKAEFEAEVVRVFTSGMQVRLIKNGIEGVINSRDIEGKCSFNQDLMQLSTQLGVFQLGQTVKVTLKQVDWGKKQIQFKLLG